MRLSGSRLVQLLSTYAGLLFGTGAESCNSDTWTTVAGGLFHTCAVLRDSTLKCFGGGSSAKVAGLAPTGSVENGFGNFGQIGSGNNETFGDEDGEMGSRLPVVDLGNNTALEVAAGLSHTCVLLTSGNVTCFGYNAYGQLGIGNETARGQTPEDMGAGLAIVDLGTGRTATHVACGNRHSCAVLDNGSLKCWGNGDSGMLGLGDTERRGDDFGEMGDNLPAVGLGTGRTAKMVRAGQYHTCAVLDNDSLKCWGGGGNSGLNYGQLGRGDTLRVGEEEGQMGDALPEVDLGTGRTVKDLAVGWTHTCVILDDDSLRCFGRNHDGQLGLGDVEDRGDEAGEMGDALEAVDLGTGLAAVSVTCGRWHTCVLLSDSSVKCFGANTSNDLGAGQLGLEDSVHRGMTPDSMGDDLEVVDLGVGRTAKRIFAGFDHTCVIFVDQAVKCWGLNTSGQLGLGHTNDIGADVDTMGANLPAVKLGLGVAPPGDCGLTVVGEEDGQDGGSGGGLSEDWKIAVSVLAVFVVLVVRLYLFCRRRRSKHQYLRKCSVSDFNVTVTKHPDDMEISTTQRLSDGRVTKKPPGTLLNREIELVHKHSEIPEPFQQEKLVYIPAQNKQHDGEGLDTSRNSSLMRGTAAGVAAAGTAGMVIAGGTAVGWNMLGIVAEHLPWVGVAYHILNEIGDIVETKKGMQGNMKRIHVWAKSLKDILQQMNDQMQTRPAFNARALERMSYDVLSNLQILKSTVESYDQKGTLAQYAACRRCQKAVDDADTALRGALAKLTVGQGAELMSMVGSLQDVGLVIDEKMDLIIEQFCRQEERQARMELRLAEYSESMAEAFKQYASGGERPSAGKTMKELSQETLDKLQISSADISYPINVPFDTGTMSEVYQVVHDGTLKAAKKTDLTRLGVCRKDVDRVFGRFAKELYILHQMRSDRVVSVYGAIVSPTELTLITEFAERGSIRKILEDDKQREELMVPERQHRILLDTAAGMTYLYNRGVEHRDLKSANCLVTHDWRVKISDFGLSNTTDAISNGSTSTVSSFRGGTLIYMAPELLLGRADTDGNVPAELSDVFSFGVIVWEILCGNGERPWAHISVNKLPQELREKKRPTITTECDALYRRLMLKCWRERPHRRPTFEEIHSILMKGSISSRGPASSGPTPKVTTKPSQQQRKRRSGRDPTIPLPPRHDLADPTADARSDRNGHGMRSSTQEAASSYARSSLTAMCDEQPSPYNDEMSTSTRAVIDADRAASASRGSAANTPHGDCAVDPGRKPMRQAAPFARASHGPLKKEVLLTLPVDGLWSKSPLFSGLGQSRCVLNEKITYAERQNEGKNFTSLDDVKDSADKRTLPAGSAPAVVHEVRSTGSWRFIQPTKTRGNGARAIAVGGGRRGQQDQGEKKFPGKATGRPVPSRLSGQGSNQMGRDVIDGSNGLEGGTTGTSLAKHRRSTAQI